MTGALFASTPSKLAIAIGALSTVPLSTSSAQSPPIAAAPVRSSEAATSAPVSSESVATNCCPTSPAPTLQPYSKILPVGESDAPICESIAA